MGWILTGRSIFLVMAICFSVLIQADQAEVVWIDVRSVVEHKIDHIEGDIRIAHDDIVQGVSELFPDKETGIRLYCRSGGRAGKALTALQEAGYKNVKNAGGINDAREERGISE